MVIKIKQATLKDLNAVSILFDKYRVFYKKSADINAAQDFLKNRLVNNDSIIYSALSEDGTYVGFTQLYPLFSSTKMKRLWLLNDLYVDENYRGNRISIRLIERAKKLAKETDAAGLLLETGKTNIIGNNLYPRAGFQLENQTNFYFWTNKE